MTRWHAIIIYRNGTVDVGHNLDELMDIHHVVERGPHWDTIEKIEIFRINHNTSESLTVQQAEQM